MHLIQQSNENHQGINQASVQRQAENQAAKDNNKPTSAIQAKQAPLQRKHKPPIQTKQQPIQRKHKSTIQAKQRPVQRQTEASSSAGSASESQIKHNVSVLKGQDVTQAKVHYNSSEPAKINAAAYAQGNEVHLASGQEKHLGHELTHVAQQMGGQVTANQQANNGLVNINDDPKLEKEADEIGTKASQGTTLQAKMPQSATAAHPSAPVVQRYMVYGEKDQHNFVSEEQYNTIHTHTPADEKKAYEDKWNYKSQMETFDKRYKRQESKGKLSDKNKRKKEGWRHPQRRDLYVSDDGRMAVEHHTATESVTVKDEAGNAKKGSDNLDLTTRVSKNISSQAWADETLINEANAKLKANKAYVTLKTVASDLVVGDIPRTGAANPSKGRFKKIMPVRIRGGQEEEMTKEANMDKVAYGPYSTTDPLKTQDCGNANLLLMGSIQEGETRGLFERLYNSPGGLPELGVGSAHNTIKTRIQQIMKAEFPNETEYDDVEKAYKAYEKLAKEQNEANREKRNAGEAEERSIDSAYGLNAYARPDLGQGIVTAAAKYSEDAAGYNFHYATNVMQSANSGDYMALEGIAPGTNGDKTPLVTTTWYFTMYGTRADQSFHERLEDRSVVQSPNVSSVVDRRR
ncbi:MAG TPA: hypothetical protein DCS93_38025 [Microscillaceae bacterium]|nr:hypothetical protein [Microscillaceae bacterium]